jgi:transposase-like protein
VAGRVRVPGVRFDRGVAHSWRAVDVPGLWPQDIGDRGDDLPSLPVAVADVVRGDVVRVRPEERCLRSRAATRPGPGLVPDSVGVATQAAPGHGAPRPRAAVAIAVELQHPKGLGRVRLARIDSAQRKAEIFDFAKANIAPGTIVYTDGDRLYNDLPRQLDITHERLVLISATEKAHRLLPAVHRVAALLKRWLAGTLHNGWSTDHLDYYLDEFTFRFNRRTSRRRGLLWYRLVQQAVATPPQPYRTLTATGPDHNI